MKTLIVIDFQKDFANPNGSLYVPGAERAEDGICSYIMEHHKEISDVVFTVDWHTFDDLSFIVYNIQKELLFQRDFFLFAITII